MARTEKFTTEQIIKALQESQGIMGVAAKKLRCSRNTVVRYVEKYPSVRQVKIDEDEFFLDQVEVRFYEAAVIKAQPWAIALALKTRGKNRGYVERLEQTGADGGPIQHENKLDLGKLNDDELHTLEDLVARSAPDSTGVEST